MKLLVMIPALNEERSIADVIASVRLHQPNAEILVIDDGSSDNTALVAENSGAKVISLPFNLGVGGALRAGFAYALKNKFTHAVQIDADGQHDPAYITHLLEASRNSDVVIGSRFVDGRSQFAVSRIRFFAMRWLAFWLTKICGVKLTDVTSGLRLATSPAIKIFAKEYPPEYLGDTVESLVITHRNELRISEIPVVMSPRAFGNSSQSTVKALWYVFRATLVLLLAVLHQQDKAKV